MVGGGRHFSFRPDGLRFVLAAQPRRAWGQLDHQGNGSHIDGIDQTLIGQFQFRNRR